MNRRPLVLALAALTVTALAVGFRRPAGAEDDGVDWRTDLGAAREEAGAAGKPLLVVFT